MVMMLIANWGVLKSLSEVIVIITIIIIIEFSIKRNHITKTALTHKRPLWRETE